MRIYTARVVSLTNTK